MIMQRAPRRSCHHKMKTMQQRLSATRLPAPGRNCRNGQGIIFYCLCMVVATLTVGSPSTSKHLIMLTCQIRSAQHSAMARTKWAATFIQYFALGMQLPPALQSLFSFHLGCGYVRKKKKNNKIAHAVLNNSAVCETNIICISITISNCI